MSLPNYTTPTLVVTVNGRRITQWGNDEQPFTNAPIDPKRQLVRGQGGGAIVTGRNNPGREVRLKLMPGSSDSKYMNALDLAGIVNIVLTYQILGVGEGATGLEGVIVNDESVDRGGPNPSNDVFVLQFNRWGAMKGDN